MRRDVYSKGQLLPVKKTWKIIANDDRDDFAFEINEIIQKLNQFHSSPPALRLLGLTINH